jgi:hypothetical protein
MDFSRQGQLDRVVQELEKHLELGQSLSTSARTHSAQVSHLGGVYSEVDKLTKGKSLVPTSDLLVEIVNSLISDAKELVHRDTYLGRLKTFVPAGDNPAYPDVLVALRILQQALDRFDSMLKSESAEHLEVGGQLKTIRAALEIAEQDERKFYDHAASGGGEEEQNEEEEEGETDQEEEDEADKEEDGEDDEEVRDEDEDDTESEESDDYEEHVWKTEVIAKLDKQSVSAAWFRKNRDGDLYFDFQKLDIAGPPRYVPPAEGITFVRVSE